MSFQPIDFQKSYGSNAHVTPLFKTKTLTAKKPAGEASPAASSNRENTSNSTPQQAGLAETEAQASSQTPTPQNSAEQTPHSNQTSPVSNQPLITQEDLAKARMEGFKEGYDKGYSTAAAEEKQRQEQLLTITQSVAEQLTHSEKIVAAKELEYQKEIMSTAIALAQYMIADPSFVPPENVVMGVITSLLREMNSKRHLTLYVSDKICAEVKALFEERMPDRVNLIDILPKKNVDILWCDIQYDGGGISYHANEILDKMMHIQQQTLASDIHTNNASTDEALA